MSQKQGRVIITSSRIIMALVIARSLGRRNVEIIGADCISATMLSMSKYVQYHEVYTNYLTDEEAFLDDLEKIILKHKPHDDRPYLLMPVFTETMLIARAAERFRPHITVACPSYETISSVHPKNNFVTTAMKHDVNIPASYLPEEKKDLDKIMQEIHFPILTKPYDESGGKGIRKVHGRQELYNAYEDNLDIYGQPPLIQELAEGEDYCLTTMFCEGEIKTGMAYRNLTQFPAEGGSGVMRETIDESPFCPEAVKLLQPLKWTGLAQFDFLWNGDENQQPYMIELNPRFWAGLYQSVQSGIDYPWLNYLLFSNQELPEIKEPDRGEKTKIPGIWLLSLIQESLHIDNSLKEIKEAGAEAINDFRANRNIWKAFKTLFNNTKYNKAGLFDTERFISQLQQAKNAENEIFDSEDPNAAFGLAYSLIYLVKHKKLPPEVGL